MGCYDFLFEKCECYLSKSYEFNIPLFAWCHLGVYIDIVIKSAGLDHHLADLRFALERMRRYGLKMNPLKCVLVYRLESFLASLFMRRE